VGTQSGQEFAQWAAPEQRVCSGAPLLIDAFGLLALAELIASLDIAGVDR
jgi:hypothetical protein